MARPKRDDDDAILDRIAAALVARETIAPWTLNEIAPSSGLSPAGLIKRFGSRRQILLALSRRWIAAIPEAPRGCVEAESELHAWVAERFAPAAPNGVARGLIDLLDDLGDVELRALLATGWNKERRYLSALLDAGALPRLPNSAAVADLLFDALNGAMLCGTVDAVANRPEQVLKTFLEVWK